MPEETEETFSCSSRADLALIEYALFRYSPKNKIEMETKWRLIKELKAIIARIEEQWGRKSSGKL